MKYLIFLLISITCLAKPIIVMEIDTGISMSHKEFDSHITRDYSLDFIDNYSHGTHIAGILLQGVCPQVRLLSCNYTKNFDNMQGTIDCLRRAIDLKPDFINYSSGGGGNNNEEKELMTQLIKNGTKILVAAGNHSTDLSKTCNYYPACYDIKDLIVVGNLDHGSIQEDSNYGLKLMVWEEGTNIISTLPNGLYGSKTGTSMATAARTNRLIKNACYDR